MSERGWPGHPICNKPVLLLIVTHRLLGARAELAIGGYTKLFLKRLDGITARALLEKNKLIETHCHERIRAGDAIGCQAIFVLGLPFLQRLFRVRTEFAIRLDTQFGLQPLDRLARCSFSKDSHGLDLD